MMPQFDPAFERSELPRPGRPQPRFGGQPVGGSVIPVTIYGNETAPTTQMTPTAAAGHAHNPYGQDFYGSGERIGGAPVMRNASSWMGVQPVSLTQPTPHVLGDDDSLIHNPVDPIFPKKRPAAAATGGAPLSW